MTEMVKTQAVDPGERDELTKGVGDAVAWAAALTITDATKLQIAADATVGLRTLLKRIDDFCDPGITRWHQGHKAAVADKKRLAGPLEKARRIADHKIAGYKIEQDRVYREKQREAEEQARKAAEDQRLREAESLEQQGRKAEADMVISQPAPIVVAPVEAPPKLEGVSVRSAGFDFDIVNLASVPRDLCEPSRKLIRARLVATSGAIPIPGVRHWAKNTVAARAK